MAALVILLVGVCIFLWLLKVLFLVKVIEIALVFVIHVPAHAPHLPAHVEVCVRDELLCICEGSSPPKPLLASYDYSS